MPVVDPYRVRAQKWKKLRGTNAYRAVALGSAAVCVCGVALGGLIWWYQFGRGPEVADYFRRKYDWDYMGLKYLIGENDQVVQPKLALLDQFREEVAVELRKPRKIIPQQTSLTTLAANFAEQDEAGNPDVPRYSGSRASERKL